MAEKSYMEEMVSVLVPVYNRVDFIIDALESVYCQTYQNFEIIVVDDGSNDGSFELLEKENKKGKIKLFTHPNRVNKGQSASLNLALEKASGRYIAILDSDDIIEPEKLMLQVDVLKTRKTVGLVYGNGIAIDENGEYLYDLPSKYEEDPSDPNEVLLDCYLHLPLSCLVRAEIFDKVGGFDETYRASQDHDMLIRISEITEFYKIKQQVYRYRQHANTISKQGLYTRWTTGFKILDEAASRFPYKKSTLRKRRAVLNYRMFEVYRMDPKHKNAIKAFCSLLSAFVLDPSRSISEIRKKLF